MDSAGNLYVTDPTNNRIIQSSPSRAGVSLSTTVSTGSPTLRGPTGVAVDTFGDIFISDTGNNRIVEIPSVLLVMVMFALRLPTDCGVKLIHTSQFWPILRLLVIGKTRAALDGRDMINPGSAGHRHFHLPDHGCRIDLRHPPWSVQFINLPSL